MGIRPSEDDVHPSRYVVARKATELLESKPRPTLDEIKKAFTTSGPSPHLCRCGTYLAIVDAVRHASNLMTRGVA
jgi:isoquinoline 1-oxidoreductase alpha subunit